VRTLIRTIKLPALVDSKTEKLLSATMKEYSKAAQMAYDYGDRNNTTSRVKIHHAIYNNFRAISPLHSQLVINAKNKGVDVLKSLKNKKNKRRVQFKDQLPIRYDQRSSKILLNQRKVSIATIAGRVKIGFEIPGYYSQYMDWDFRSFELIKRNNRFFLHFVVQSFKTSLDPHSQIFVGIDRGIRHVAVTSQNKFYNGSRLREVKNRYFRLKRHSRRKALHLQKEN